MYPDHADTAAPIRRITADQALYGVNPLERVVAVEPGGPAAVTIYRRQEDDRTVAEHMPFRPWLVAADEAPWRRYAPDCEITALAGDHPLNRFVQFSTWASFRQATGAPNIDAERFYRQQSPVSQFLTHSGITLFKGMTFEDIRRLQLDIETLGLDPTVPDAQIIMVALRQGDEERLITLRTSEADLLTELNEAIAAFDPDVIEGHNIFNFDLHYIAERARRSRIRLPWGRDGSDLRVDEQTSRFRSGPQSLPYHRAFISGRHIIDTYQQIQRTDQSGKLQSYGLKAAIEQLGLTRSDRVFVAGGAIADLWRTDPDKLAIYAMDDVRDVDQLARVTVPTEFYQSQIMPMPLQRCAVSGTGTKINELMARCYLAAGHSLPLAEPARAYPGGFVEVLEQGVFGPVVKCDVESLYPSIMLVNGIHAHSDTLQVFPTLLKDLTQRRIDAKRRAAETGGVEHAFWDGLQSTFKILINSFYGYLGFAGGMFNDMDAAEKVTLEGQRLIKQVEATLTNQGALPIEVDTDGVYFRPPDAVTTEAAELEFVESVGAALPAGIRLAHDGRFARMLSLKQKTYALLHYDGKMTLKGSALRSRRMERCFRTFIQDAAAGFMQDERDRVRDDYFALAERIQTRTLPPEQLAQWTMLNRATIAKQPKVQRLLEAFPNRWRYGERVDIYERQDGQLAFLDDFDRDENIPYLLRRLRDSANRFADVFPSKEDFDAFFPQITPTTSLAAARQREPVHQLGLFG